MTLKEMILDTPSKESTLEIASYISDDDNKFEQLWQLVKTAAPPVPRLAAWIMEEVVGRHPSLLNPWLHDIIDFLPTQVHDGVRRNLVKILARTPVPEERHGELYDICLDWLIGGQTPVAIKVWCMEICTRIAWPYPELREELALVIEEQMPFGSKGFVSRGRKTLKRLRS